MNPSHTLRLRRVTSAIAVAWVLFSFLAGLGAKLHNRGEPSPPFTWVGFGGVVLVAYAPEASAASGVRIGDRLLAIDGTAIDEWTRFRARPPLRTDQTNRYHLEHRDGMRYSVELSPVAQRSERRAAALIGAATTLLGAIYFAGWVAFLLGCSGNNDLPPRSAILITLDTMRADAEGASAGDGRPGSRAPCH